MRDIVETSKAQSSHKDVERKTGVLEDIARISKIVPETLEDSVHSKDVSRYELKL